MERNREVCPDVSGKDPSPYARNINLDLLRQAIDDVVGESVYTPDYDFGIFYRLQELEEQNGLPDGETAESLMQQFNNVFHYDD